MSASFEDGLASLDQAARKCKENDIIRKIWDIGEPKGYRLPKWFSSAVNKHLLPNERLLGSSTDQAMRRMNIAGFSRMFDHWGVIREDGMQIVVGEPYPGRLPLWHGEIMSRLLALTIGCRSYVKLQSWHNPGRTYRIEFLDDENTFPHESAFNAMREIREMMEKVRV